MLLAAENRIGMEKGALTESCQKDKYVRAKSYITAAKRNTRMRLNKQKEKLAKLEIVDSHTETDDRKKIRLENQTSLTEKMTSWLFKL